MTKKTLKEKLRKKVTRDELKLLRRAFDIVGDIAILEIPNELKDKENVVAETVMAMHPNIRTVVKKEGMHKGRLRRQKMVHLLGRRSKETVAVENGVKLKLNIERVYYSPRQATERKRIYGQVKQGERVLVMFSGIGPYALEIAKHSSAKEIVGIELNAVAHRYAVENAKINKTSNAVFYNGDVKKAVAGLRKKFDRIVMPLPKSAEKYLDAAFAAVKKKGIIHFYDYEKEEDIPQKSVEKVKNAAAKAKKRVSILAVVKCGQLAVRQYRVCVDFEIL